MKMQEKEIKDKAAKIEYAEQCITTLNLELKVSLLDLYIMQSNSYLNVLLNLDLTLELSILNISLLNKLLFNLSSLSNIFLSLELNLRFLNVSFIDKFFLMGKERCM